MELFKLLGTVAINGVDEAKKDVSGVASQAEKSESKISKAFKKIGAVVATAFAVDKIAKFGVACIQASANVKAMESQFTQVFGDMKEEASANLSKIADEAGIMETRMMDSYTKIAAFAKTTGSDTAEALDIADRAMIAVADSAAFYDRTLEETTESLQSFLKGNYENDAALGLSCTEITRNTAANELYGKSFKDLSESQKQLTLLKMVEDANKLSGALGQASRESDTWTNQTGNLNQAWIDFKATIGSLFLEPATDAVGGLAKIVEKLNEKVQDAIEWVQNNQEAIDKWKERIKLTMIVIGEFLIILNWGSIMSAAATAIGWVKTAMLGLNNAMLKNPIGMVIAAATALITVFVHLYRTNEEFREKVNAVWEAIKEGVKAVLPVIEGIVGVVTTVVTTISKVVKTTIKPVFDWIIGMFTTLAKAVKSILKPVFDWIGGLFTSTGDKAGGVIQVIKDAFTAAADAIMVAWEAILPFFDMIWEYIIEPLAEMFGEMIGAFQEAWDVICLIWSAVAPFFKAIWEQIKAIFSVVADVLGGFFKTAWDAIKIVWDVAVTFFKAIWEGIKGVFAVVSKVLGGCFSLAWEVIKATWNVAIDYFTAIWAGIKAVFATVEAVLSGDFSGAWEAIKNSWKQAGDFFNSVWEGIKGIFGGVADWFGSVFSAAWEAVLAVFRVGGVIFDGITEAIADVFVTVVNAIIRGINTVIAVPFDTINGILNNIRNISVLGVEPFSGLWSKNPLPVPKIPELEEGGVLEKGQVGLLEGNGSEAVVPLDKNEKWIRAVAEDMEDAMGTGNTGAILGKMNELIETIKEMRIYLDTGILVGELTPAIDTELGQIYAGKGRGR